MKSGAKVIKKLCIYDVQPANFAIISYNMAL